MENFRAILTAGKDVAFVVGKGGLSYDGKVKYANDYTMVREEIIQHIAFFADYVYTISVFDKNKQELDVCWTQCSYILIGIIFFILLLSIRCHEDVARTVWVVSLFLCMIGLKAASLYVVRSVIRLEAV